MRDNDVYVVQSFATPVNDSIMELLIMIDTLRRASAGRITAVIPYFGYGRTDKKDQPRVPITARLVAKLVGNAGADRALSIDLHAGQIQGFFDIPVDEMTAMPLLARYFMRKNLENPVVVSPDLGNTKRARNFAEFLDAPLAIIEKRRMGNKDHSEILNLIGSVEGCQAVLIDDEIDTAGSITQAAQVCLDNGATEVYATSTHAVLSGPAYPAPARLPHQGSGGHRHHRAPTRFARQAGHHLHRSHPGGNHPAHPRWRQRLRRVPHPRPAPGLTSGEPLPFRRSERPSGPPGAILDPAHFRMQCVERSMPGQLSGGHRPPVARSEAKDLARRPRSYPTMNVPDTPSGHHVGGNGTALAGVDSTRTCRGEFHTHIFTNKGYSR